jgi:hypothetical protein
MNESGTESSFASFRATLREARTIYPDLFEPASLGKEEGTRQRRPPLDVKEIPPPGSEWRDQWEADHSGTVDAEGEDPFWSEFDGVPDDRRDESDAWQGIDEEDANEQEPELHRAGVELLAVYRPFHFYPEDDWGVLFFERPMAMFVNGLARRARSRGQPISRNRLLKIVTYCVARHEFQHYLTELDAFQLELRIHRNRLYKPYWDRAYKKSYPGKDCVEETVANVRLKENPLARSPPIVRTLLQDVIRRTPLACYRNAAGLDARSVHPVEDRLGAQVVSSSPNPASPPPIWGVLARPYFQPWTRYENVPFRMTTSAGRVLCRILNGGMDGPIRKTMRIYHW